MSPSHKEQRACLAHILIAEGCHRLQPFAHDGALARSQVLWATQARLHTGVGRSGSSSRTACSCPAQRAGIRKPALALRLNCPSHSGQATTDKLRTQTPTTCFLAPPHSLKAELEGAQVTCHLPNPPWV